MMNLFLVIGLLLTPLAFAEDSRALIALLGRLNTKNMSISPVQCTEDVMQKCAVELCGKPSDAITMVLNDRTFDDYVKPGVMQRFGEVENQIIELVKDQSQKNEKFITDFKSKLVDGKFDLKIAEWSAAEYDQFNDTVFRDNLEISIDYTKELSERYKLSPIYPEGSTEVYKKALDSYIKGKHKLAYSDLTQGISATIYTLQEAKALIQGRWNKFYQEYSEKLKIDPDFMRSDLARIESAVKEVADLNNLDSTYQLIYNIESIERDFHFETIRSYPPIKTSYICTESDCQKGIQEYLSKFDFVEKITKLTETNVVSEMTKMHLAYCKSSLAAKGLEESDKESILKMLPDITNRILTRSAKAFSDHSRAALEAYLNESIHLSFKPKTESIDDFINTIHEEHKRLPSSYSAYDENDPKSMVTHLLKFEQMGMGLDPMAQTYFCQSAMEVTVWDAFLPQKLAEQYPSEDEDFDKEKDNIFVSKFSCTHTDFGKGVLAHEMGHAMSWAFKESKLSQESLVEFKKLRACANSHHKKPSTLPPMAELNHEGDSLRTEEDTADLISYMAYNDDTTIFECALIDRSVDEEKYIDLSLENSIAADTHSSPFFRALMEAVHKKRPIPESCREVINSDPKFGFESCF